MMIVAMITGLFATLAAALKGGHAWGPVATLGILCGLLPVLFFVPFGAIAATIAGVVLYGRAQTAIMERVLGDQSPIEADTFD